MSIGALPRQATPSGVRQSGGAVAAGRIGSGLSGSVDVDPRLRKIVESWDANQGGSIQELVQILRSASSARADKQLAGDLLLTAAAQGNVAANHYLEDMAARGAGDRGRLNQALEQAGRLLQIDNPITLGGKPAIRPTVKPLSQSGVQSDPAKPQAAENRGPVAASLQLQASPKAVLVGMPNAQLDPRSRLAHEARALLARVNVLADGVNSKTAPGKSLAREERRLINSLRATVEFTSPVMALGNAMAGRDQDALTSLAIFQTQYLVRVKDLLKLLADGKQKQVEHVLGELQGRLDASYSQITLGLKTMREHFPKEYDAYQSAYQRVNEALEPLRLEITRILGRAKDLGYQPIAPAGMPVKR